MDDFNLRIVKKIKNFIEFYKGFFFISSLATLVICILIKLLLEEDIFYVQLFIDNWDKQPITDIKFSQAECPLNYETATLGLWPISSTLCDCRESLFYSYGATHKNRHLFKPYSCNLMMRMLGCIDSDELKQIKINEWKGKNICIKRQKESYLDILMKKENSGNIDINNVNCDKCDLKDSLNKKICSEYCPLTNKEVNKKAVSKYNRMNGVKFSYEKKHNRIRSKLYRYFPDHFYIYDNFTTYDGLEMIYNKNFNITLNNRIIEEYTTSDIFITEHYPCLIFNNVRKINVLPNLYDFVLDNMQFVIPKQKNEQLMDINEDIDIIDTNDNINKTLSGNSSIDKKSKVIYKLDNFQDVSLKYLDKKDCYFYENSYFDRRHYLIDISNFYQFLLSDINKHDKLFFNNLTLTYEEMSHSDRYSPTNTIFLLSSPFYGWNIKLCNENPKSRMQDIIASYNSTSDNFLMIALSKAICFLYLTFHGLLYGYFENYIYPSEAPKEKKESRSYLPIIYDMVYYFLNIVSLCFLIQTAFTLRHLTRFHYLNLIRRDCVDENSTKIFNYLYDICEEKFIYCMFLVALNSMEFIFFTIVLNKGYDFLKRINFI